MKPTLKEHLWVYLLLRRLGWQLKSLETWMSELSILWYYLKLSRSTFVFNFTNFKGKKWFLKPCRCINTLKILAHLLWVDFFYLGAEVMSHKGPPVTLFQSNPLNSLPTNKKKSENLSHLHSNQVSTSLFFSLSAVRPERLNVLHLKISPIPQLILWLVTFNLKFFPVFPAVTIHCRYNCPS